MVAFVLLLIVIPGCFSCNGHKMSKNRAKVIEDYVVSAKFDESNNFPQINEKSIRRFHEEEEAKLRRKSSLLLPSSSYHGNHKDSGQIVDDFEDRDTLEERDLLVHHHHLPPVHHPPPPPPPPPAGLAYGPSLFAVGLMTFFILLNSLQTSLLLLLKPKTGLLGGVTGALGRRKRSVSKESTKFQAKTEPKNPFMKTTSFSKPK